MSEKQHGENQSDNFETKLTRLEDIVRKLENPSVSLDESVALFHEGKTLAAECETLLKDAEASVSVLIRSQGEVS